MSDSGRTRNSMVQPGADSHKTYPYLKYRRGVWREIVHYIVKDLGAVECLVELGPGFCDFINQFPARRKICFELNSDMQQWVGPDVEMRAQSALEISSLGEQSVDCVFASNFLEHLGETELDILLPKIHRVLKKGGRLVLLQPNYRLCPDRYFDDETHQTIFSDENIADYLQRFGLTVTKLLPGLLPFSMNSWLPKWPALVRIYLSSPCKPKAGQMYVVAEKEQGYLER